MACCGRSNSTSSTKYPYEAVMPDGTKVMVSSAAQERVERDKARSRMRDAARGTGYSVHNA